MLKGFPMEVLTLTLLHDEEDDSGASVGDAGGDERFSERQLQASGMA